MVVTSAVWPGNTHERTGSQSCMRARPNHHLWMSVAALFFVSALAQRGDHAALPRLTLVVLVIDFTVERGGIPIGMAFHTYRIPSQQPLVKRTTSDYTVLARHTRATE